MASSKGPVGVTLFAYQVGFGDCFLLRFRYPKRDRHVLIDFGSMELPEGAQAGHMRRVAADIAAKCNGQLEVVVATHRHADHISGFATGKAKATPGNVIAGLHPRLVVQPWTEHPRIAKDAQAPMAKKMNAAHSAARALSRMQAAAASISALAQGSYGKALSPRTRQQLTFIGRDNIKNLKAVENLMKMGRARNAEAEYVYYGAKTALNRLLPGVKVHVLGPPTVEQHEQVREQNPTNRAEYWHLQAFTLQAVAKDLLGDAPLFPRAQTEPGGKLPADARWLARRVRDANEEQLLGIVRSLDDALNNTSVILLFEVAGKKLLFPGDAQWENWEYALSREEARDLLKDVNLYKVGHHGSLNATPKSMWTLLENRGKPSKKGRLTSVLSTLPGKHGEEENESEVPRGKLLDELTRESHLHNTDELPPGSLYHEVTIL
jgi:hypothetical protein